MGGETRGQQLLPGDPEQLLRAKRVATVARNQGIASYSALSVTRGQDGAIEVRVIRLDLSSRRVVPEFLERIEADDADALTDAQALAGAARKWVSGLYGGQPVA